MKKIQLNIQEKLLEFIDKEVSMGIYPSRAEAIRSAIKEFVSKESNFIQNLNSDMVKLNEIHKRYVEFNEEALAKLGISTDYHIRESSISSANLELEKIS